MIPAQAVEAQPEPCEYCSIAANALKVHDGSCNGMTEQEWRELRGKVLGMSEVIPTEAIEAAADMIGSLRLGDRQRFLTEAQLILEAAAPHMQVIDSEGLRKILDAGSPHHRSANDAELDTLVEAIIAAGWHL